MAYNKALFQSVFGKAAVDIQHSMSSEHDYIQPTKIHIVSAQS